MATDSLGRVGFNRSGSCAFGQDRKFSVRCAHRIAVIRGSFDEPGGKWSIVEAADAGRVQVYWAIFPGFIRMFRALRLTSSDRMICLGHAGLALMLVVALRVEAQVPLSETTFKQFGSSKATVILQVNWGRYWKCGPYENAQLQKLAFRHLGKNGESLSEKDWELSPLSTLLAKPSFEPYAVLLDPGQYALSGFRFKVATSSSDVRVAEVDSSKLIVDGKAVGGVFTATAGEAVYIGHFGVDCKGEPTPWRFYVEKEDFDRYVDGFHKHFPFAKGLTVTYGLFQTERFGQPSDPPK